MSHHELLDALHECPESPTSLRRQQHLVAVERPARDKVAQLLERVVAKGKPSVAEASQSQEESLPSPKSFDDDDPIDFKWRMEDLDRP
eukprot:CAMPEP_0170453712 /NCGR_PEP_ID=MMETSP0123-20130129/2216_1 /TAXON_ID=182087 /ORGANISM="Favella ehrenbergii, Strain Fehren 1" /LENGTH=87 /DNA_ID=CAMNT_0010716203 /DNA_START=91 /DNA_END=355 /DNA_ORIENTATION=-